MSDSNQLVDVELDGRFRSGLYKGYYRQNGRTVRMSVTMTFRDGMITAEGTDEDGNRFAFHGHYSSSDGRCSWSKHYSSRPGALHVVDYAGVASVNGITGLWTLKAMAGHGWQSGDFLLGPEATEGCTVRRAEESRPGTRQLSHVFTLSS